MATHQTFASLRGWLFTKEHVAAPLRRTHQNRRAHQTLHRENYVFDPEAGIGGGIKRNIPQYDTARSASI